MKTKHLDMITKVKLSPSLKGKRKIHDLFKKINRIIYEVNAN